MDGLRGWRGEGAGQGELTRRRRTAARDTSAHGYNRSIPAAKDLLPVGSAAAHARKASVAVHCGHHTYRDQGKREHQALHDIEHHVDLAKLVLRVAHDRNCDGRKAQRGMRNSVSSMQCGQQAQQTQQAT